MIILIFFEFKYFELLSRCIKWKNNRNRMISELYQKHWFWKKSCPESYMLNINKVIYFLNFILFSAELAHLSSFILPEKDI